MTKRTPEYYEEVSFSSLVKAIDEKWSHTYEKFEEPFPEITPTMDEILQKIADLQGDYDEEAYRQEVS